MLSLIIPAYKQEKTIVQDLRRINRVLANLPCMYEMIVVVDGEVDHTLEKALKFSVKEQNKGEVKVYSFKKNLGKGSAVSFGVLKSKGDIIGFIDAGMDINPFGISTLLNYMIMNDSDIVVGSKLHPDSRIRYPLARRIMSWGYRTLTRLLFGFQIRDTQVGLKIFKRKVALDIFPRLVVKKFAFDIELLAVAYSLGYKKIDEAPVRLNFSQVSSITSKSFWSVISRMLWDTIAVFYRLRVLNYYDKIHK